MVISLDRDKMEIVGFLRRLKLEDLIGNFKLKAVVFL